MMIVTIAHHIATLLAMELNQNRRNDSDDGSDDQDSRDRISGNQTASKQAELGDKNQSSRPTSQSHPDPQTNKSWTSTNPFINFMSDFRKLQPPVQRCALTTHLGGKQWRNMTPDEKQPFIDAANKNKILKRPTSNRKRQQKQSRLNKPQSKSGTSKDSGVNQSGSSRKVPSPNKRKGGEQNHEIESKKKRTKIETDTNADTDTSGSIHTVTTDCASEDSDT